MNRKQLTLLLAAVVVIGGLGLWVRHQQMASYRPVKGRMGEKVLGELDVNAVAGLRIVHGTNAVNLQRKEGRWRVAERGDYPADFSKISELVRQLAELKTAQTVEAGESQLGRLELRPPDSEEGAGTLIELKKEDGSVLASLLLGKKHLRKPSQPSALGGDEGWPDGRYVMVPGKLETLSLVSETFSSVEPKPEQWLDKEFFKIQKIRKVQVTWPEATNSWTLSRTTETGSMVLEGIQPGETLDTARASSVANALGYPSFTDVIVGQPEVEALFTNAVRIRIETFDDFVYNLQAVKDPNGDDYYLKVDVEGNYPRKRQAAEDEKKEDKEKLDKEFAEKLAKLDEKLKKEQALSGWIFRVSKWTLDAVLKKRSELLKAPEPKTETESSSEAAAPAEPAAPAGDSLVPKLEPIPPAEEPASATDIIKPAEPESIEAPPSPPTPPTHAAPAEPNAERASREAGEAPPAPPTPPTHAAPAEPNAERASREAGEAAPKTAPSDDKAPGAPKSSDAAPSGGEKSPAKPSAPPPAPESPAEVSAKTGASQNGEAALSSDSSSARQPEAAAKAGEGAN
ncbi:MAG: DUF4340 domain-containing protein [Verrucomicrobia bacterium]|nr:MAG: DUF4340 domain-containing protein [Verrucomicrobiota bacterium]